MVAFTLQTPRFPSLSRVKNAVGKATQAYARATEDMTRLEADIAHAKVTGELPEPTSPRLLERRRARQERRENRA